MTKKKVSSKLKETLLVAQEISLVKILCDNEQLIRHRGLHKLTRWLRSRSEGLIVLGENDFNRLWKGLFYCLWMADKLLYQEEVAELISQMMHCFSNYDIAIVFVKSFFNILGQEWPGIDYLRMDKCMMLVRRMVRQSFVLLDKINWELDQTNKLASCYKKSLDVIPDGLIYHLSDVYVNELSKIGGEKLDTPVLISLLRPFADYMSVINCGQLISHISSNVFLHLIRLTEEGVEHQSRFKAWKDRGFPGGSIEVIKKLDNSQENYSDSDSDDNETFDNNGEEKVLDPRAGHVNVELPTFNFDPSQFVNLFDSLKYNKTTTSKARKQINELIKKFNSMSAGKYPLGLQKFELPDRLNWKSVIKNTAKELIKCEENDFILEENNEDCYNTLKPVAEIERYGSWKVTPTKRNNSKNRNSFSLDDSLRKVPIKWEIIEKNSNDKSCNSINGFNGHTIDNEISNDNENCSVSNERLTNNCENINSEISKHKTNNLGVTHESQSDSDEIELVIRQPKKNRKRKRSASDTSGCLNGDDVSPIKKTPSKVMNENSTSFSTPVSGCNDSTASSVSSSTKKKKRVAFLLTKNTVQEEREYKRIVRNNPVVKFDGEKRPAQPIYKDKGIKSPINPFYKTLGFTSG